MTTATASRNGSTKPSGTETYARAEIHSAINEGAEIAATERFTLPEMRLQSMILDIVGTSPLITHRFSEKAKKKMRDKHAKKATTAKEVRNPVEEFTEATYFISRNPDRYGVSANAFYSAALDAALALGAKKSEMRRSFTVRPDAFTADGPLVEVHTPNPPTMREDTVTVGMGSSDLRYRPEFQEWSCKLRVVFDARQVSAEQIANLLRQAGFSTGIGEWRQEKEGFYGSFDVRGILSE